MKRISSLIIIALLALVLLACNTTVTTTTLNTAPVIAGVQGEVTIALGETFNVLTGVSATDAQDGDLTADIVVESIPVMVLTSGIYTPEEQGEYYITYSVTDAGGLEATEFTTLTVTRPITEETLYKDYLFDVAGEVDLDGWQANFSDGASGVMEARAGRLVFQVDALGTADYHAKLYKVDVAAVVGTEYELIITMSSSVASKLHFIINNASLGWSPAGGIWNLEVSTTPTEYSIKYTVDADTTQIEYLLQMGGDLNTAGFELYIDQVELVTSVGTETPADLVVDDFTTDANEADWGIAESEAATSSLDVTGGSLVYTIANYDTEGKPWNINLYNNTGINLENGKKYQLTFDVSVVNDQFFELCFENSAMDWQIRAGFNNGTFTGTSTFTYTFFASMDITGLYIKLALGQGTGSNVVTIDNFSFVELVGDKVTDSTIKTFMVDDSLLEWGTYNANGGVGAVYTEDGSLFYSVQSFGGVDWHNKFFIKQITLEAGAVYRISFTVKADKALKCFFALNVYGQWDPRITQEVDITTEETTFTFTMDSEIIIDMDFELLFQFGGYAQNEGPAVIEFTAIEIFQQK